MSFHRIFHLFYDTWFFNDVGFQIINWVDIIFITFYTHVLIENNYITYSSLYRFNLSSFPNLLHPTITWIIKFFLNVFSTYWFANPLHINICNDLNSLFCWLEIISFLICLILSSSELFLDDVYLGQKTCQSNKACLVSFEFSDLWLVVLITGVPTYLLVVR